MKFLGSAFLLLLTLVVTGCVERQADLEQPSNYDSNGLQFSYPGNWKITEDESISGMRYVFIESPGDAIAIVQVYERDGALGLADFADNFAAAMKAEIPIGEVSPSIYTKDGVILSEVFSISLLGQEIPHQRDFYSKDFGALRCFLVLQVSQEDMNKTAGVMELLVSSLRHSAQL